MWCRGEMFVYLGQLGQLNLVQLDLMFVKYSFPNAQLSPEPLLDCASWNSTILWENDNILKNKCNSCTNVEKRYYSMREKCPHSQYFWPYSVRMRENTDQKNYKYGHFSRNDFFRKGSGYRTRVRQTAYWKKK